MFTRREVGPADQANVWFSEGSDAGSDPLAALRPRPIEPVVLHSEEAVGRALLGELEQAARQRDERDGPEAPVNIALLGGRGAQVLHKLLGQRLAQDPSDPLIRRLVVFTQDALAPLPMASPLSFVRDFERLLGAEFFQRVRAFVPFETEQLSPEISTLRSLEALHAAGGLDVFFIGHGPEPEAASHLAYVRPGSGARVDDWGGAIPISDSILDHHISKFRAGGSSVSDHDERQCRAARYILTLGPAAILGARRVVQSVVDASTAPAKRESYRRVLETELADDSPTRARQLDDNPGLWVSLHDNFSSYVLPDLLG